MVILVVAWQLTHLGTATVVIQRSRVDDVLLSSLFYFNMILGMSLSVATIAAAAPLAAALGQPQAAPAIRVLAVISVLGAVGNMHYALLRRTMQFGRLAMMNIATAVVSGVVGISLAVAGAGIWGARHGNRGWASRLNICRLVLPAVETVGHVQPQTTQGGGPFQHPTTSGRTRSRWCSHSWTR